MATSINQPVGAPTGSPPASHSAADRFMRRLLRVPDHPARDRRTAERAFSTSMVVSGTRCLLTYLVFPFVLPALGLATGVGPAIGLVIGVVALVSNVISVRRFWMADHKWKWEFTVIDAAVMALLVVLLAIDLSHLVG